jgi:hypothetical protein
LLFIQQDNREVILLFIQQDNREVILSCFLICSPKGSDCGIVNVNIPTSGAEIGGAFGKIL